MDLNRARPPLTYDPEGQRAYHKLQDEITKRAFEIYLDRVQTGRPGGALDDWLRAEAEVCARFGLKHRPLSHW
jgi:hypothetical protein